MARQALTPFGFEIDEQASRIAMDPVGGTDLEQTVAAAASVVVNPLSGIGGAAAQPIIG